MHKLVDDRTTSMESMLVAGAHNSAKQTQLLTQNAAAEVPRLSVTFSDTNSADVGDHGDDGTTQMLQFQANKIVTLTQEKLRLEEALREATQPICADKSTEDTIAIDRLLENVASQVQLLR